ncbi:MAG: multiprotein bridging factor aMBF1 [Candidatus Marsarchaeota archaeon]|jgi:putative transcription factor|nr:multiprotein bridging factor aMBF1 [Candidatus Marsarchaeota archaeon]MCL5112831.1 multiprotein bridging factor aMBF1 [Candidatus Marsarchaeota archaeon]
MEECEICGRRTASLYTIDVDGTEMRVCPVCAEGKRIIARPAPQKARGSPKFSMPRPKADDEKAIVQNYGTIIRRARERMELPLKVLAEMINEKESFLRRIEEEKTVPAGKTLKQLERALGIKLLVEGGEGNDEPERVKGDRKESASLGDFLGIK